jgi:RNA polymerase sigma-70 factor (ECF subfamily)
MVATAVTGVRSTGIGSHQDMAQAGTSPVDFDGFFEAEERDLLRFCWGLTVDSHDARDVAQEAMTRAYSNWDDIAGGNPAGWIRTVALNLVRNDWRSSRRRDVAVAQLAGRSRSRAHPDPASDGSTSSEVIAALRSLTARQREAVVLHHMADWSVAEVAAAMDAAEATVKTHLQRGRTALAKLLGEDFGGGEDG